MAIPKAVRNWNKLIGVTICKIQDDIVMAVAIATNTNGSNQAAFLEFSTLSISTIAAAISTIV